jgi:hypothetical protein
MREICATSERFIDTLYTHCRVCHIRRILLWLSPNSLTSLSVGCVRRCPCVDLSRLFMSRLRIESHKIRSMTESRQDNVANAMAIWIATRRLVLYYECRQFVAALENT